MKLYELKMQDGGKGVFRMSTVKGPAIEDTLLFFGKEEETISHFADEEKRVFYAPAMIPNKKIFRSNVNGEPAEVFYTEESVEQFQINYFRQNGNNSNNVNHELHATEGFFPFESWTVLNFETDKAKELGFNVPNGTWMMGYKVDNNEVWDDIKAGNLDGLSIEATNLEHILKKEIMTKQNEKSSIDKIFDFIFNMKKESEKTDEEVEPIEEEEIKPVEEVKPVEDEEMVETEEVKPTEEPAEPAEPTEAEQKLIDENVDLKQKIAELEAEKVKAATDLEAMAVQTPGAEGIPLEPSTGSEMHFSKKPYNEMTNKEKMLFNRDYKN